MITFTRPILWQHLYAFLTVSCVGAVLFTLVLFDRADPIKYIDGKINPNQVRAGEKINIWRKYEWKRRCEGIASRTTVGPDQLVRSYTKAALRIPSFLGVQESTFSVPLPSDVPSGKVGYHVVVQFHACGITSRWWPIEIEMPVLSFNVISR